MNIYRNPWHKQNGTQGPAMYKNEAPLVMEHRGVKVYKLFDKAYDLVFNDCCISQRCGCSVELIDRIMDGKDMFTPAPESNQGTQQEPPNALQN